MIKLIDYLRGGHKLSSQEWVEYWPHISPFFSPDEVLSPDGLNVFHRSNQLVIDIGSLLMLNGFRQFLKTPIRVNSKVNLHRGYRSHDENAAIKGAARFSFHLLGKAFDISCAGVDCETIYEEAQNFGWKGVGIYDTWVHVDNRPSPDGHATLWDKRTHR